MIKKKRYFPTKDGRSHCWSDYPGVGRVYDKDIADFTIKHVTLFDRLFRPWKIAEGAITAEGMFFKVIPTPEGKWYF